MTVLAGRAEGPGVTTDDVEVRARNARADAPATRATDGRAAAR